MWVNSVALRRAGILVEAATALVASLKPEIGPDSLPVYELLDREGALTGRVVTALWWDRTRGHEQIADFIAIRERLRSSRRLDGGTVKVMLDGMVEKR